MLKEKPKPESADLATLELKANLNPEQRAYLEVLKDKMRKILGGKTKQELAKAGDLVTLKNYKAILEEILEFLRTKEMKIHKENTVIKKGEVKVFEERNFSEREIKDIITMIPDSEINNILKKQLDNDDLICSREIKDYSGRILLLEFKVKDHLDIRYDFYIKCEVKGFKSNDVTSIRRFFYDETGFYKVKQIAEYRDNYWVSPKGGLIS